MFKFDFSCRANVEKTAVNSVVNRLTVLALAGSCCAPPLLTPCCSAAISLHLLPSAAFRSTLKYQEKPIFSAHVVGGWYKVWQCSGNVIRPGRLTARCQLMVWRWAACHTEGGTRPLLSSVDTGTWSLVLVTRYCFRSECIHNSLCCPLCPPRLSLNLAWSLTCLQFSLRKCAFEFYNNNNYKKKTSLLSKADFAVYQKLLSHVSQRIF